MANGNELKDYSRKISRMALFMDEKTRLYLKKRMIYIYIGWFIPKTFRCFQQGPPQKTTMEWFPRSRKNRGTAVEKDPGTHLVQEIGQGG